LLRKGAAIFSQSVYEMQRMLCLMLRKSYEFDLPKVSLSTWRESLYGTKQLTFRTKERTEYLVLSHEIQCAVVKLTRFEFYKMPKVDWGVNNSPLELALMLCTSYALIEDRDFTHRIRLDFHRVRLGETSTESGLNDLVLKRTLSLLEEFLHDNFKQPGLISKRSCLECV
jgi:hypothetical protein